MEPHLFGCCSGLHEVRDESVAHLAVLVDREQPIGTCSRSGREPGIQPTGDADIHLPALDREAQRIDDIEHGQIGWRAGIVVDDDIVDLRSYIADEPGKSLRGPVCRDDRDDPGVAHPPIIAGMPRLVVLGASGWLGSAVATSVKALDPATTTPSRTDLRDCSVAALRAVLAPADDLVVLNLVGLVRGTDAQFAESNERFVLALVEALAETGAYLVHAGSPAEYGDPGGTAPIPESHPLRPASEYGHSKAAASEAVLAHAEWCVLRPFNVIDYDMAPTNPIAVIRDQVRASVASGDPVRLPAAHAVRDHVSRDFVARSFVSAVHARYRGAFNLCSGIGIAYADIAKSMAAHLGGGVDIVDDDSPGIRVVIGDPAAWTKTSGLVESMDADRIAGLVLR